MPEQNENQRPPRRISFGLILAIILVVGIIAIIFFRVMSSLKPAGDTFTVNTYITELSKGNVQDAQIAHYYPSEKVAITGTYKKGGTSETKYTINTDEIYYTTVEYDYTYVGKDTEGHDIQEHGTGTLAEIMQKFVANNKIEIIDLYESNWWSDWGPTIIMLGGSALIMIFLFSRLSGAVGSSNRQAMDFSKSRARRVNDSKVRFKDVAGCDEEKAEMEEIVEYLKDPQKFTKFGAKLPKGILLVGSPGTGKTLLAKAIAGEAGVPFFSISGSDFVEMFVGVGAGRVRDLFETAKKNAPCLVFIDEIDAVGRQRGAVLGGGNDEREQTLNQLLVEMDGFSDNSGIIVIAATNRDDVLDPALLRAGRFDRKITVSLPDREGRKAIFIVHSRNKKVAPDVNFDAIAARTVGFSGADIENIMNEAAILAVRRKKSAIGMDEIDEAIDRRIAGPAKSSRALN